MTTPKPDEAQALIAAARLKTRPLQYEYLTDDEKLWRDLAAYLERDHAIVERVTRLLEAHELADTVRGDSIATKMLRDAIYPPAEQPQKEPGEQLWDMLGEEYAKIGYGSSMMKWERCSSGAHKAWAALEARVGPSPDRSATKCGRLIVSDRLCNNSAGHDGDCSYTAPPAAQPKPPHDRSAIVAELLEQKEGTTDRTTRAIYYVAAKLIEALS